MQKTTDKLIKKQLEEEAGESLRENLKRSILSSFERKAAEETAKNVMEKRFTEIARAEILKESEYPAPIGSSSEVKRRYEKLMKSLDEAGEELKSLLGDKFIALRLHGSYAKGYPYEKSDVDIVLLLTTTISLKDAKKAERIIGEAVGKATKSKAHLNLDTLRSTITEIQENGIIAAESIHQFFVGRYFGERIHDARKEIVHELAKSPFGEQIWDDFRKLHSLATTSLDEKAKDRIGINEEDFEEIVKSHKKFALPSFEEMKKKYGVA